MTGELSSGQMTRSQEEFSIHLSQAIKCLHSHHHHIKTWAALFIGGQHRRDLEPSFHPDHPPLGWEGGSGSEQPPIQQPCLSLHLMQGIPPATNPRPCHR